MRAIAATTGLVLLLVTGCASKPENTIEPGHEGAPGVERFLLCSPNMILGLPAQLQGATTPVRNEIEEYLRLQEREVQRLNLYDGKIVWNRSVERAKREGDIGRATEIFASELGKYFEFQAIVVPSVSLHQTRVSSSSGSWDGVRRHLRMQNVPTANAGSRGEDTLADGLALGGVTGDVAVTSLHVLVFDGQGTRVFEGRGGLDFIHDIDLSKVKSSYEFDFVLRRDLLQDSEALREGIEIAFTPYLAPTEEP